MLHRFFNMQYFEIKNKLLNYKNYIHIKKIYFIRNFNFKFLLRKKLHFIHPGRTGGTFIRQRLIQLNNSKNKYHFNIYGHLFKLKHLGKNKSFFFTIRNPINRFLSAFLSRQNRSKFETKKKSEEIKKYKISEKENESFKNFFNANHLAESFFSDDIEIKNKARSAMENIKNINDPYTNYFSKENLIERKPIFVLETEKLDSDFSELCKKLKLEKTELPLEENIVNQSNYFYNIELSEKAISNLKKWYKNDFDLYHFILENKKKFNS